MEQRIGQSKGGYMAKQNKVAVNLNQDFTEDEMTTARNNIRAASTDNIRTINGTLANLDNRVNGLEQQLQQDKFELVQQRLKSDEGNTSILKDSTNTVESLIYTGNFYKEYAGNIGFTTTTSGNMSICVFDANKQLIYPTQCVNFAGPFTGVTNFIPFTFKEEPDKERISYIGIKGSSNGNAEITHLFYIGKKE